MKNKNNAPTRRNSSGRQPAPMITRPWLGIGVLVLIIAAALYYFISQPKTLALDSARLAANPSLGSVSAKITIVEYGDFGCTTCLAWERAGVLKQIRAAYGDKVQFVWKDYPIITAQSPKAAEAGQCALDQGKFWEYHDLLYAKAPALDVNSLKDYAAQLGLDTAKFNQCLDSGQNKAKVDQSMNEAQRQYAFPGTPSFLINGKPFVGPQSFETLKSMIDGVLAGG